MKNTLGKIPVFGYLLRWILSFILLPRKLAVMHHQIQDLNKDMKVQKAKMDASSLKVLELKDELSQVSGSRKR